MQLDAGNLLPDDFPSLVLFESVLIMLSSFFCCVFQPEMCIDVIWGFYQDFMQLFLSDW